MDNNAIVIDNIQINDRLIQSAFENAKYKNKTFEVLSQTFRMLNLAKLYQVNPNDSITKQMIKNIVNSQMLPQSIQNQFPKNQLDLSQVFPLNKLGNFGRLLQRQCRVNKRGVMQFQEGKQPKLKEIKRFVSTIEVFGQSQNDDKIGWISNQKKYRYRIILIDKSDGHKGIYFSNPQKAEQIRLFFSQNYRYSGNFVSLANNLNRKFSNVCMQAFKNKLITRNKLLNKSNRYSRNVIFGQNANQNSEKFIDKRSGNRQQQSNLSVFYNEPLNRSQRGYTNNSLPPKQPENMIKIGGLLNTRSNLNVKLDLKNLQRGYNQNLFSTWLEKAKMKREISLNRNFLQKGESYNYSPTKRPSEIDNRSKIDQLFDKSSRKQESVYIKQKDKESIFRAGQSPIKQKQSLNRQQQSFINQFNKQNEDLVELVCYNIQFLTLNNLFFKPIVTVQLIRNNKPEQSIIYNTLIKKKQPHLLYSLTVSGEDSLKLNANLRDYIVVVRVIDFLANEEVITDRIVMTSKKVMEKTTLMGDNRLIKLEMGVRNHDILILTEAKQESSNITPIDLHIPPLAQAVKQKISSFWQKQSQAQGYYNEVGLSLYKILSQFDLVPLTWWKGIPDDDYQILQILNASSKILGFRMIRSFTHIIKVFASIYPDLEEMIQKLLSFILTFLKPYYFPQELNRIQKFHRIIGLEQDCEFISKVNVQILTITKLIEFQCPLLNEKMVRRNICYGYTMMQYIYQAFSRNFSPNCLVELWNYILGELDLIQLNMVVIAIVLIKYYEQDLMKCKRLNQFSRILENKKIVKIQHIIKQVMALKQKYFGQTKGFLDQIKNIFNSKPLQPILFQFYKRETTKIDKRKINKQLQKKSALRKVNKQIDIQFPEYPSHKYCLHIYFCKLPQVGGSLTIRCNDIDYECLNHEKNRYFIISEVSGKITLNFLDLKSNDYSCDLVFNQGINQFTAYLTTGRNNTTHKIIYFAGLLTETQIDIFKKGKKFNHFISPFVKQSEFEDEMNRPINQTVFLRKYDSSNSRDDLIKKIKVLFCSGSKTFNQIQFYLQQIETSQLTIEQKIDRVKQLALNFSNQFCLSNNKIFQKHFLSYFFNKTGFYMTSYQFECFYNDSLDYQFDAPKIIKCRFIPVGINKEVKLEIQALTYLIQKSSKYLYADIIVDDLIQALKLSINQQLGGMYDGELRLLYSSNGEVNLKSWQIRVKNKSKQVVFEQMKEDTADDIEQMQIGEPQILMTQVLPSFAKISTILDYVNSNRNVDLKTKYQDKDRKKIAQKINILKDCQSKFNKIISMRHQIYPKRIHLPFFSYYYELVHNFTTPPIKSLFLNNLKSDLKNICLLRGELKFGQNAKIQSFSYQNEIGLYGNLRKMARDSKGWFFFSYGKEDNEQGKEEARVFVNYGYGVFRWQPCIVLGFALKVKPKSSNKISKDAIPKKQFLILFKKQERFVKEYELKMKEGAQERLQELTNNSMGISRQPKYFDDEDEMKGTTVKYLTKFIK